MPSVSTSARSAKPNGQAPRQNAPQTPQEAPQGVPSVQPPVEPSNPAEAVHVVFERLAEPFDASEIKERPGRHGEVFRYIDARTARRRLNAVLGHDGWECRVQPFPGGVQCAITIRLSDGRTITREGIGGTPDSPGLSAEDAVKSGDSDAFKRACVLFGIGEYLYDFDPVPSHTTSRPSQPARDDRTPPHWRRIVSVGDGKGSDAALGQDRLRAWLPRAHQPMGRRAGQRGTGPTWLSFPRRPVGTSARTVRAVRAGSFVQSNGYRITTGLRGRLLQFPAFLCECTQTLANCACFAKI